MDIYIAESRERIGSAKVDKYSLTCTLNYVPHAGLLQALRADDKPTNSITSLTALTRGRLRTQPRHCFLFSKHLLVTMRVTKKPQDCYRIIKVLN